MHNVSPGRERPGWLKAKLPAGETFSGVKEILRRNGLHTVCEEALCPNRGECWGRGTATFMILGDTCTRYCRFCAVKTGNPRGALDREEPERVARAVGELQLRYVVLTSVDRDDLEDGGAEHFARTVRAIKKESPSTRVEVLIPDFGGRRDPLVLVLAAGPDVLGHNIETVERLTRLVRDRRATYRTSIEVLAEAKRISRRMITKSGLMLGLGETKQEVLGSMSDLRAAGVDVITLGQYLQPTREHLPVAEYVPPESFAEYRRIGCEMGFRDVVAGPLVRSSYLADRSFGAACSA